VCEAREAEGTCAVCLFRFVSHSLHSTYQAGCATQLARRLQPRCHLPNLRVLRPPATPGDRSPLANRLADLASSGPCLCPTAVFGPRGQTGRGERGGRGGRSVSGRCRERALTWACRTPICPYGLTVSQTCGVGRAGSESAARRTPLWVVPRHRRNAAQIHSFEVRDRPRLF
jgi:hypothetical protein